MESAAAHERRLRDRVHCGSRPPTLLADPLAQRDERATRGFAHIRSKARGEGAVGSECSSGISPQGGCAHEYANGRLGVGFECEGSLRGVGRVAEHDRHPEGASPREVAVVLVAVQDDDAAARGQELLQHLRAHRAEADEDDVSAHRPDPPPPERALDAPAHQQLRELREEGDYTPIDLKGADLRGVDMSCTHLFLVDLTAADMTGANLHGSLIEHTDIVDLVRSGNIPTAQAVRQAGRTIGEVLATCVSLLNPSVIVLGGSLVQAGESLVAGVREVVYGRSLPLATGNLQIVAATTGVQAGVMGAATMVVQHALTADRVDSAIAAQSAS